MVHRCLAIGDDSIPNRSLKDAESDRQPRVYLERRVGSVCSECADAALLIPIAGSAKKHLIFANRHRNAAMFDKLRERSIERQFLSIWNRANPGIEQRQMTSIPDL
jgi:hypothetical protein